MPSPDISAPAPLGVQVEQTAWFRCAQLLLLFNVLNERQPGASTPLERVGYFDYFAANPFALFDPESPTGRRVRLSGWSSMPISNASTGQRWTTRRARLWNDLTLLVSWGLVGRGTDSGRIGYALTDAGERIARQFRTFYADSYESSAKLVIDELGQLSETALARVARERLKRPAITLDLYESDAEFADPALESRTEL